MGYYYDNLLTYDGTSWTRINEVPVDDRIAEIVIDNFSISIENRMYGISAVLIFSKLIFATLQQI